MIASTGIVPAPPLFGGAIESHSFALANAIAQAGVRVHLIGDIREGARLHPNVTHHPVHSPIRRFPVPFPGWIMSHLIGGTLTAGVGYATTIQEKVDVAHFHEETSAMLYLRLRPRARLVFTLHNPPSWLGQYEPRKEAFVRRTISTLTGKLVIEKASHFIALSEFVAIKFCNWLNLDKERVSVIGHPVDTDFFKPDKESERRAREKFALAEPYIIFVGRLDSRKGVANLLQAVAKMPSKLSTVIIGDGVQKDALIKLAKELNIQSLVRFLGPVSVSFLPGLLSGASCMVLPSLLEMSPLTVIESLSCGTPVVATDLPIMEGVIKNGHNGLLVQHNVEALTDAISKLNTDQRLEKQMRHNARKSAVEDHSPRRVADRLIEVYDKVSQS